MKILYFYQYFGTPKGGWSTRVYEFTRRWVLEGHEVTVITSPYDKSDIPVGKGLITKLKIEGINIIIINLKQSNQHSLFYRSFTFFFFSLISIYYALKLKGDIIIASSGPITVGLPAIAARYFTKKKIIFEVRDLWPEGAIQLNLLKSEFLKKSALWFEKRCYSAAHVIVTCSIGMSNSIKDRFSLKNVFEIPNSSDIELFSRPNSNFQLPNYAHNKKLIIYTGSLGLMDNCIQIVEAAKVLSNRNREDILFIIAGEGKEKKEMEELVNRELMQNVVFLGLIPKNEVVNWLNHSSIALLVFKNVPVLQTSSPNKLFDYMAASLPVIQTTSGWIKDLIDRHKIGINVSPNAPEDMANAIEYLLGNNELREKLAFNSRALAENKFNRDHLSDNFLKILSSINND